MTDRTVSADTLREMLAGEAAPNRAAMTHTAVRRDLLRQIITLALEALALRTPSEGEPAACDGQLCYYHGCQYLPGCAQGRATALATPPDEGLGEKVTDEMCRLAMIELSAHWEQNTQPTMSIARAVLTAALQVRS